MTDYTKDRFKKLAGLLKEENVLKEQVDEDLVEELIDAAVSLARKSDYDTDATRDYSMDLKRAALELLSEAEDKLREQIRDYDYVNY